MNEKRIKGKRNNRALRKNVNVQTEKTKNNGVISLIMNIGIIDFVYLDRTFMFFRRFNVYKEISIISCFSLLNIKQMDVDSWKSQQKYNINVIV